MFSQSRSRGKRTWPSVFLLNTQPALTWRLNPGPGPSLYLDQLQTAHRSSLQHQPQFPSEAWPPEVERAAGHPDMVKAASPGQMDVRRVPGEGWTPGLCLGHGFKAKHGSQGQVGSERWASLPTVTDDFRTIKSHQETRVPGSPPLPTCLSIQPFPG